ncbi:MAG: lipopolysaccharide assembly protein [Pseudomonadota bacterium]|nr:lipopolysaccharide assembly protein [Pseudomonadota bacterium]
MRFFSWLFRAAVFFVLFAFALNNQHEARIRWFLGFEFRAPMVLMVLVVFAAGALFGVLAMMPNWWRQRRRARAVVEPQPPAQVAPAAPASSGTMPVLPDVPLGQPPRDGL